MALKDCIGKAGKALDGGDVESIEAMVAGGMSESDAVAAHIAAVEAELADVTDRAVAAGATRVEPTQGDQYARAGDKVDGRVVRDEIPNRGSIRSSLDDYTVLPGVREIPLSEFTAIAPTDVFYARNDIDKAKRLAEEIRASGEIAPLIVVIDNEGPYVLEGAHRLVALGLLGAKSLPALVVQDNESLTETRTLNQAAYHGTPHTFDRFSTDYMGMGEGAQAFGWGLYFAENEDVAEGYHSALQGRGQARDGSIEQLPERFQVEAYKALAMPQGDRRDVTIAELAGRMDEADAAIMRALAEPKGGVYQVDIPDEATARFLDWDKPLSEQAPEVREALEAMGAQVSENLTDAELLDAFLKSDMAQRFPDVQEVRTARRVAQENDPDDIADWARKQRKPGNTGFNLFTGDNGAQMYGRLSTKLGGDRAASLALNAAGIPGIKFLDQGSRNSGDGSRNLVVFDDKLITITHKDGSPVTRAERADAVREMQQSQGGPFSGVTREQFLGTPKITGDDNASALRPKELPSVAEAPIEPFAVGEGLTARYSDDGAAVYRGDKVIASYNFGDVLVVDKSERRQGIAEELVYQWRSRNPSAPPATQRTKKAQRVQENVWKRIVRERGRQLDQPAYHGTPHDFDRFSTDYMGTGEGAQAFGWGLYFAENPGIAAGYHSRLAGGPTLNELRLGTMVLNERNGFDYSRNASRSDLDNVLSGVAEDLLIDETELQGAQASGKLREHVLAKIDERIDGYYDPEYDGKLIEAAKKLRKQLERPGAIVAKFDAVPGGVYQVDIPDTETAKFLDWDLPLSRQADSVRDALATLGVTVDKNAVDEFDDALLAALSTDDDVNVPKQPVDPSGESVYRKLQTRFGSDKAASEALSKAGIRGIRFDDAQSRGDSEVKTHNLVVFDDSIITVTHKNGSPVSAKERADAIKDFMQASRTAPPSGQPPAAPEQPNRGNIQLFPDGRRVINLGTVSDRSTFLHEAAHLFLDFEGELAAEFGVTPNQQAMLDFLSAPDFASVTREQHEKWAESFEVYLRDGKAPSVGLRSAFAAFSRWLTRIYQTLTDPRLARAAALDDETRAMFDRLLATQEEIDRAAGSPQYDQFFRSREQAGMTDEQWVAYQRARARVTDSAQITVEAKALKQYKAMREAEWNDERAPLIEEETERLRTLPVYAIIGDISKGYPFDYDITMEVLGITKPTGRLIGKVKKGGVDPAEYAELHGYPSTRAMLEDVLAAPSLKDAATDAAQTRMIERHGDILNDGTIEQEVRLAMHNEAEAELLVMEIKALDRRAPDIDREYLRSEATRLIGTYTFKQITPDRFYRAEIKAAQNAARATNPAEKRAAKIQQLANHYLYREAVAVKGSMDTWRRYVRRAQTKDYNTKEVDPAYAQNIRLLATMYEMRKGVGTANGPATVALDQFLNWYETQIADPNEFVQLQLVDPWLIEALETRRKGGGVSNVTVPTFDDLTVDQLQGLHSQLRHLRFVGGTMSDLGRAEFTAERDALAGSILDKGGRDVAPEGTKPRAPTEKTRWADALREAWYGLINLRNLTRRLDGNWDRTDIDGPAYRALYRVVEDAETAKVTARSDLYDAYREAMNGIQRAGLARGEQSITTEDGQKWTTRAGERVMLALYWGTESSRAAIMEGHKVTENDVMRMMALMTPEQLKLVNAVWAINESLWPDLSGAATRMYGVAPVKLDAVPFEVNGVRMTGGHMRLYYNSLKNELEEIRENGKNTARVVPSRAGSTFERVGSGGKPVLLDPSNITRAYNDSVHFIAFAEPSRRLAGMLNTNSPVTAAIVQKHGEQFYKSLIKTIEGVTSNRNEQEASALLAKIARHLRGAASLRHIAYSVRNAVQNLPNFKIAMDEVGMWRFVGALVKVYTSPAEMARFVHERSILMKNRVALVNREASEIMKEMSFGGPIESAWNTFKSAGFVPQKITDALVSYPLWIARYDQQIDKGTDPKDAARLADEAVATSVGSGADLQLGSHFQMNRPQWVKTMTVFGSWFNNYFNRLYRESKGFGGDALTSWSFYQAAFTTPIFLGVLGAALMADWPDDDESEAWWAAKAYIGFMGGLAPLLRDIVGSFKGIPSKAPLAPVTEIGKGIATEIRQNMEGDQSGTKGVSDALKIMGGVGVPPLPGLGNVTRFLDYKDSFDQGNEGSDFNYYQAIMQGPTR